MRLLAIRPFKLRQQDIDKLFKSDRSVNFFLQKEDESFSIGTQLIEILYFFGRLEISTKYLMKFKIQGHIP